jgi:hypothetical protein
MAKLIGVASVLVVLLGIANFQPRRPPDYDQLRQQVAVLLCSHHWAPSGAVRLETPAGYRSCMASYAKTGRVP